jgi:Asp-tRNA(Asn)/Glu-tRNA(Gln) amidotransferase A subunit family amidase
LFLNRDIGGPMARSVADAVAVFDVIAGEDPADQVTAASRGRRTDSYLQYLDKNGLRAARIGVVWDSCSWVPTPTPRSFACSSRRSPT